MKDALLILHRLQKGIRMSFIKTDPALDMTTTEGIRAQLQLLLSGRADDGSAPRGDIEVFEPEFVDYNDEDGLTVKFPIREWQLNGVDNVQGGVLSCMIDCAFGTLSFVMSGCNPVGTVDMTSNYLRPITSEHKEVTIKAKIMTNSRRVMHATAQLYNSKGKVAVTASTNIMKLNTK